MKPLPLPNWRRLNGTWHVEIVIGATKTRCTKPIPAKAKTSTVAKPTHCAACLEHYRECKKNHKAAG